MDWGWPRKFHGSSICCQWGSLFSYWWVSRSAGLCGFQQAPQRLPDGPSQDGAYCGSVSMGALQMEPLGVIRLLRQGVREGVGGRGVYEQQGVGDGHIFEVDQSHWTVMRWFFFFFFRLFWLRFCKGRKHLCVTRLQTGERDCKSPDTYLLKLQGEEAEYLGQSPPLLNLWFMKWYYFNWEAVIN